MSVKDTKSRQYNNLMKMKEDVISIKVGVMGSEASQAHVGAENTVADIASKHEFGIDVPQRSFIRETFDVKQFQIKEAIEQIREMSVKTNKTPQQTADLIGLKIQSIFVERIVNEDPPFEPLSEVTVDLKGSSKPLVNTGQLKSSITYVAKVGK